MNVKAHVLRLDLPGLWADGWLYKEHLILWSRTGEMHVVPLSELVNAVEHIPSAALDIVANHLIFRNDWKSAESFKQMMSVSGIELEFLQDFPERSREIVVPMVGIPLEPAKTDKVPGVVLDAAIYANHVYAASTEGLFETRFDPDRPVDEQSLVPRFEKRTSAVTAGYSVFNWSAGEDGLRFSRMDFDDGWSGRNGVISQVADVSQGHSFASYNLLNYTGSSLPSFMRSSRTKERSNNNPQSKEWRISGYDAPSDISGVVASALTGRRYPNASQPQLDLQLDEEPIGVLGNSGNRLLVSWGGSLSVVDISLRRERDLEAKRDPSYGDMPQSEIRPDDILDTHAFGSGFLVELPEEVRLINAEGSHLLMSEPVARIRTFPHSRRHKEVILLVRESGVSLLGVYMARG